MPEPLLTPRNAVDARASATTSARETRPPGKRTQVERLGAIRLPPGTPPRVPKAIDVIAIDTGGLGGIVRDAWREKYGRFVSTPDTWAQINAVLTPSFWHNQLSKDPKVRLRPSPLAGELTIFAELGQPEEISSTPTWRAGLFFGVEIDGRTPRYDQMGWVDFALKVASTDETDPLDAAGVHDQHTGAISDDTPTPRPKKPRPRDRHAVELLARSAANLLPPITREQAQARIDGDIGRMIADAIASIQASPSQAPAVLHEYWDAICDHWPELVAMSAAFIAAELAVAALAAAPDPSMATKVAAVVLQAIILVFIGFGVLVELAEAAKHALAWYDLIRDADGDPEKIAAAGKEFCHIVLHLLAAALAVAGLRAKVRGRVDKTPRVREADGVSADAYAVAQVEARTGIKMASHVTDGTKAERYAYAFTFYRRAGWPDVRTKQHLPGIDLDHPIEITTLRKGTTLEQYQIPQVPDGNYFADTMRHSPDDLGISWYGTDQTTGVTSVRERRYFIVAEDTPALRSVAAGVDDTWSARPTRIRTNGGGIQYFVPNTGTLRKIEAD